MTNLTKYNESIFESIKHIDEKGIEYWEARELQKVLEYKEWRKFEGVIEKAKRACNNSGFTQSFHFVGADKMSSIGKGSKRKTIDYKLSRYACYLIVQNGDPRKAVISLGQTYFAVQTRKQELTELEYKNLSEDKKRLYQRSRVKKGNYTLNITAKKAGVKNFDKFHNAGYKGLYNGETAADIAKRKKLNNEKIKGEKNSCDDHFEVGKAVRDTIDKVGGTLPENLPTPDKSIKYLTQEKNQ